jgi:hypothetical protein
MFSVPRDVEEPKRVNEPSLKWPGFVSDLHYHRPGLNRCTLCEADWPCAGARRQHREARQFTNAFWLDEARFAELIASCETKEAIERDRRTQRKAAQPAVVVNDE